MRRAVRLASLAIAASLALAACGGGRPSTSARSSNCPQSVRFPGTVSDHGSATAGGSTLSISAGDFFFSPTCETEVSSGTVVLRVTNHGQALHNVSVPSQGIDEDAAKGETITVRIDVGSGPLVYFCKYHKGSGMYGALVPSA
jgi:plastocyanin